MNKGICEICRTRYRAKNKSSLLNSLCEICGGTVILISPLTSKRAAYLKNEKEKTNSNSDKNSKNVVLRLFQ